jgi:PAS domain S-box-containing protein
MDNNEVEFFKEILSQLPGDVAVFDREYRYVFVNTPAIKDIKVREWIIGKTDFDYCEMKKISPEIAEGRWKVFKQIEKDLIEVEIEERIVNKYGNVKYHLRRVKPFFNQSGEFTHFLGYGIDVTKERELSKKLEESKNFVTKVIDSSPHLIYVKDIEGRFLMANQAVCDLMVLSKEELILKSLEKIHSKQDEVSALNQNDQEVIMQNKAMRLEEIFTKSNGELAYFDTIKVPLENSGLMNTVLGISTEITDRKKKEQMLELSEQRMIVAQRLLKTGNWDINYITGEVSWSSGMFEIWERDPSLGPPDKDDGNLLCHPGDYQRVIEIVSSLSLEKDIVEFDYRVVAPLGIKKVRAVAKASFDEDGKLIRLFGTVIDVTEQIKTEEELLLNQSRLNEAQQLAKMGSFDFDVATGVIEWSEGVYHIFNRPMDLKPLTYDEYLKYVHPDDLQKYLDAGVKLNEKNETFSLSYRIVCENGDIKHISVVNKLRRNDSGKLVKVFGTVIDETERKKSEELLQLNESRLLEAQEIAKTGNWEIELKDKKVFWSKVIFKIWQRDFSLGPPTYDEFMESINLEDRSLVWNTIKDVVKTGEKREAEFKVILKSGQTRNIFSICLPYFDADNNVVKVYGTSTDITEQKAIEHEIVENKQRLVEAQELAKLGSWQLDLITGDTSWSIGTYIIWDRNQALPPPTMQEVLESIDEEDRQFVSEAINNAIKDKSYFNIEYRITTNIGKKKIINGRGIVQQNEGIPVSFFGTVLDITDRKKVEEELLAAKIQAQDSIRTKEYFLANIGHELRTPLNGILGMARLLQKTEISAIQRSYIDVLNVTAGNLLVIINDILDSAKIESGTLTFDEIIFDPMQVADTAIQVQLYKAEEKDLVLRHLHEGPPMPKVVGDPYRLNQVLLNLLSNAVKFTDSGEVVLVHKVLETNGNYINIEFSIQDTGIGIPPENQSSIFESFMQLNSDKPYQFGGTGLGLSISKNLVEKQGGTIGVKSTPGFGSTFTFTIPYKKAEVVEPLEIKHGLVSADELGPLRVLLAEDNRVNQYITEAMLQDWGFKVDIANNGTEAVDLYNRKEYDIILMDIQMPELNGIEATRLIRANTDIKKASVPIIALTANTTRQIQRNLVSEGMNDFLVKPFKEESLYKKIAIHILGKDKINSTLKRKFPTRKRPIPIGVRLYNLSLLRDDARDNPEFIKRMLNIFIETIPPIIEKMHEHYENNEMDAISTLAHKIKPTLDGAGIISLKESIRNIESYRDKKRTPEQLKVDIDLLQKVISIVTSEFVKELKNLD